VGAAHDGWVTAQQTFMGSASSMGSASRRAAGAPRGVWGSSAPPSRRWLKFQLWWHRVWLADGIFRV